MPQADFLGAPNCSRLFYIEMRSDERAPPLLKLVKVCQIFALKVFAPSLFGDKENILSLVLSITKSWTTSSFSLLQLGWSGIRVLNFMRPPSRFELREIWWNVCCVTSWPELIFEYVGEDRVFCLTFNSRISLPLK